MNQSPMLLIGLMSGTSADGIDAALVEVEGEGRSTSVRLLAFVCQPHDLAMRQAILRVSGGQTTAAELCALDAALGERFAEVAMAAAAAGSVPLGRVEAIASHGQTVWHQPETREFAGVSARGTLQVGSPAVIAARTGCTVVSNFRAADMAVGGQGAPLVPYFDWAVLTSDDEARAVLNIGGIANVTHLPRAARRSDVTAFDTGPGNMVIDALAYRFSGGAVRCDEGGARAARGHADAATVARLLREHPYFGARPPKSTGREMFGEEFAETCLLDGAPEPLSAQRQADAIATGTLLTAASIARAFHDFLPRGAIRTVIVGGGGCHNATLMPMLAERLAPARLTTHAEFGIPDDAKEAMAFALLAYETLHGRPGNVLSATGAAREVVLGSVTAGQQVIG